MKTRKSEIIEMLKAPNTWVNLFSLCALMGLICFVVGIAFDLETVKKIGIILVAPLLLGGIVLLVIVIPFLIVSSRRKK